MTDSRHDEDNAIFQALLEGDSDAWDQVSDCVKRWLDNASRRQYIPHEEINDIRQDILAKLIENNYQKLQQFSFRCRLSSWIGSIVQNHLYDHFESTIRREKRNHAFENTKKELSDQVKPSDRVLEQVDFERLINKALEALNPDEQIWIRMIYWDGLTPSEVALIVGEKVKNITSRLHRAREKMRKIIKPEE